MRHDFEGQVWAENHEQFSRAVSRLLSTLLNGAIRFQSHKFDAPWKAERCEDCKA